MKYFKVKIGFGADDFISIEETELQKALKAQIAGGIVVFKEGSVAGNNIISITPDYNRKLGLSRSYTLQPEDYRELGDKEVNEYRIAIQSASENAQRQLKGLPPAEGRKQLPEGSGN